jgi:hypothetical protein
MKRQTCTMSGQKSQERNPEEERPHEIAEALDHAQGLQGHLRRLGAGRSFEVGATDTTVLSIRVGLAALGVYVRATRSGHTVARADARLIRREARADDLAAARERIRLVDAGEAGEHRCVHLVVGRLARVLVGQTLGGLRASGPAAFRAGCEHHVAVLDHRTRRRAKLDNRVLVLGLGRASPVLVVPRALVIPLFARGHDSSCFLGG